MGLNGNSATATLNCVCSHIQNKSTRNSTNPVGFYMVKINPSILLVMSTSLPAQNVLAEERLRWRRGGLMKQRTKEWRRSLFSQRQCARSVCARNRTCDVVLFEGVTVDLVLIGTVFLQPLANVRLGPQSHRLGQLHISWLRHTRKRTFRNRSSYILLMFSTCSDSLSLLNRDSAALVQRALTCVLALLKPAEPVCGPLTHYSQSTRFSGLQH